MQPMSRREFHGSMLASLTAYGLIETLFAKDLFAANVKPVVSKWMVELHDLCKDLKGRKMKDVEFQAKLEDLYKKVDLSELVGLLKLDEIQKKRKLPDHGAVSIGLDLSKVEGLPNRLVFGKQIFGVKKGHSVVPHGHNNMCTGFVVLSGKFHGRHYDRIEDRKDKIVIKPTIDNHFGPGKFSTVSDHKDNIHWFKAETDTAYLFNIHVLNYDPTIEKTTGRVYLDPDGDKISGGLILANRMTSRECHRKYG